MIKITTLQPIALEREAAANFVGLSIATLERLERDGSFPKPRLLSPRRIGFLVRELIEWLETRPVSDGLPPQNTGARKPKLKKLDSSSN
jgi:prophage regulatory protein